MSYKGNPAGCFSGKYFACSGLLVGVLALAFLITGCGTPYHQLYMGPKLPSNEIALLKGSEPIILRAVDGKYGPNGGIYNARTSDQVLYKGGPPHFVIELLPGTHTLQVAFKSCMWLDLNRQSCMYSKDDRTLTFNAKAGKVYLIQGTGRWLAGNPAESVWSVEIYEE